MKYTDFVKSINNSLYVLIPKKVAQKVGILEEDQVSVDIEKTEVKEK